MSSSSLLVTSSALRLGRVCLTTATLSATTLSAPNALPIITVPRLDSLLALELSDMPTSTVPSQDTARLEAAAALVGGHRRQEGVVATGPRTHQPASNSSSSSQLPRELAVLLLPAAADALVLSPRSASIQPPRDLPLSPPLDLHRPPASRDLVLRTPPSPRGNRGAFLLRRPTRRSLQPPRHARALSTLSSSPSTLVPPPAPGDKVGCVGIIAALGGGGPGGDGNLLAVGLPTTNEGTEGQEILGESKMLDGVDQDRESAEGGSYSSQHRSAPNVDELDSLLRHPALYDPVLAPRFPIVLCHGLFGFDVLGPGFIQLHYWGDLLNVLRGKIGAEVFATGVPGTGSIKQRAHVLHEALQATDGLLGRDLNFIAHSMGGLDARYLLSNIRPTSYNPRSLTTISTPHRGTEFMFWARENLGFNDRDAEAAARRLHEDPSTPSPPHSLERPESITTKFPTTSQRQTDPFHPHSLSHSVSGYLLELIDSPAYSNLTPSFLRDVFNPGSPDRADIKYYSLAGRCSKVPIWHPLALPKMVLDGAEASLASSGVFLEASERGNDGMVTIESAKWGEFLGVLDGDHFEVRGGSSRLDSAVASAKAVAEAAGITPKELPVSNGWKWQDVYSLIGASKRTTTPPPPSQGPPTGAPLP